jgi:lathosterol oxidase
MTRDTRHVSLETFEPTRFGSGFIAGLLSAILGIAGLGAVLAIRFPQIFTYADTRSLYPLAYVRALLHLVLVASFLLGSISVVLRRNKVLGLTGISLTLVAALLGGSQAPLGEAVGRSSLGLDFFVLNLILYSAVFVPLERVFALRPEQQVFRAQWVLDLTYFFINSLLIELLTLFTLRPAAIFFDWARVSTVAGAVSGLPLLVQVPLLVVIADFTQYWVHRTFHVVPFLWRFHAIHHSAEQMDWLAGSRLHLVDTIVTRGLTYVPVFVLGFSESAIYIYVFIVAAQATFIHANVRWELRAIRRFVATPAFHHWHHSAERAAVNKNFAVHTPVWDMVGGTYYLPDRWPESYGLSDGSEIPRRWTTQLMYPFRASDDRRRP